MCTRVTHAQNGSNQFEGFVVVLCANAAGRYSRVRVPLDGMGLSGERIQITDSYVTGGGVTESDDWLLIFYN